jgi:hypothetical protein
MSAAEVAENLIYEHRKSDSSDALGTATTDRAKLMPLVGRIQVVAENAT